MEFTNEGAWDRSLRIAIGLLLLGLGWFGIVGGWPAAAFKILGFLPLITGVLGWCPAYDLFGITTRNKPDSCC